MRFLHDPDVIATRDAAVQTLGGTPEHELGDKLVVRGRFSGLPAEVEIHRDEGDAYAVWRVRGPTHGVRLDCSPPAIFDEGKNFTGNPAFDAVYSVNGAPREALRHLLTADVQQRMVALGTQLHLRGDCVECLASKAHDASRARGILELGALVLGSLPEAVRANGSEPTLRAEGTPANHPEVATRTHGRSDRLFTILLALGAAGSLVLLGIVVVLILIWILAR